MKCKHNIDAYDSLGFTALHPAILNGDLIAAKFLITKGAKKQAPIKGKVYNKYRGLTAHQFAKTLRRRSELHESIFEYLDELP